MEKNEVELLAPAGSYESMKAAFAAGADAVYIGGNKFGARAYANNLDTEKMIEAIDYAHFHGRCLYLTVNTLLKEQELKGELYEYLSPFYEAGLDAVIVQDIGAMEFIKRNFPQLHIHISTQMSVTGPLGAMALKEMGASRIVTAREISLKEMKEIRNSCDIEIESFVHGALCYCYSGQCLFSSVIGGRSGNRGRCAQPCRLSYEVFEGKKRLTKPEEGYVLSPKDLNTLESLPAIVEAGVTSLKIEGRMKKPEYTAGVVSIYRKYLDHYLEHGKESYKVTKEDQKILFDLFNRKGFTTGYYSKHNGKDMITLTKPEFRTGKESLTEELHKRYVEGELKKKINGNVTIIQHVPVKMELAFQDITVEVEGVIPGEAQSRPATEESVKKQLSKTGGTPFTFDQLNIKLEDGLFLPVVKLNELRREGLTQLEEAIKNRYRRSIETPVQFHEKAEGDLNEKLSLNASVETKEQLDALLDLASVETIYMDSLLCDATEYASMVNKVHLAGKKCFLMLPQIFRTEAKKYFREHEKEVAESGFDGVLIRSFEEIPFIKDLGMKKFVIDHMLYTYNEEAEYAFKKVGSMKNTLPVELNSKELKQRGCAGNEMIVYGRLPMMVSAQCIKKTVKGCDKQPGMLTMKDRMKYELPVKNHCRYCYNTIYNSLPLSLFDKENEITKLGLSSVRLIFTVEDKNETRRIADAFGKCFIEGKMATEPVQEFTRGHYKRGVE